MNELIVIEIGTNSIKELHAKHVMEGWQIIADKTHPTRLGQGVSLSGAISSESAETSLGVIGEIIQSYNSIKNKAFHVIATESLRIPSNADEFIAEVKNRFGLNIVILSGREEAELAYIAGTFGCIAANKNTAVIDIGGGSTEIAIGQNAEVIFWQSLPIGAVNLTERFIKNDIPTEKELVSLCQEARTHLKLIALDTDIAGLTGVGGTLTTLALLQIPDIARIDGLRLDVQYINQQARNLSRLSLDQRRRLEGMPWRRAEIIIAGTIILQEFMAHLGLEEIIVSARGVRHGYLYSRC